MPHSDFLIIPSRCRKIPAACREIYLKEIAPGGAQGLPDRGGNNSWITSSICCFTCFSVEERAFGTLSHWSKRKGNHGIHEHCEATRWNHRPALRHMPLVAGGTRDQVYVATPHKSRNNWQRQVPGPWHFRFRRPKPLLQVDKVGAAAMKGLGTHNTTLLPHQLHGGNDDYCSTSF